MISAPTRVVQIECNIDDMTGEALGYALEQIIAAGALDAWFTPIQMKKNRPAVLLAVLCREFERERYCEMLLRETTTLGVRWHTVERYIAQRSFDTVTTPYGEVQRKLKLQYGRVIAIKPEYDDCARLAEQAQVPLQTVTDAARAMPVEKPQADEEQV
ncbi:MAG: LarC family nickel insertion protein [Chloroflexi bacterium]|nr:LarC family nickel insertion protein [Chloroflexota bacterium]